MLAREEVSPHLFALEHKDLESLFRSYLIENSTLKVIEILSCMRLRGDSLSILNRRLGIRGAEIDNPLTLAIKLSNHELIPLFIENGAKLDHLSSPNLLKTLKSLKSDELELALRVGCFSPSKIHHNHLHLSRPLIFSLLHDDDIIISRAVLVHDATLARYRDELGFTPLILAANLGSFRTCSLLLEYGAEANVANIHGFTALHAAAQSGSLETVITLLERGARPSYTKSLKLPSSVAMSALDRKSSAGVSTSHLMAEDEVVTLEISIMIGNFRTIIDLLKKEEGAMSISTGRTRPTKRCLEISYSSPAAGGGGCRP